MNKRELAKLKKYTDTLTDEEHKDLEECLLKELEEEAE